MPDTVTMQVLRQYSDIRGELRYPKDLSIKSSQLPLNKDRNRYFDVVPFDTNRVVLNEVIPSLPPLRKHLTSLKSLQFLIIELSPSHYLAPAIFLTFPPPP